MSTDNNGVTNNDGTLYQDNLDHPNDTNVVSDTNVEGSKIAGDVKNTVNVGHLELLEERPVINKERLDVGKVTVTKHSRTKTVDVPIELIE